MYVADGARFNEIALTVDERGDALGLGEHLLGLGDAVEIIAGVLLLLLGVVERAAVALQLLKRLFDESGGVGGVVR